MRAKPTTGIDALPSPEEHDHRTWPAMPEGAACRSDKKKGPRQNPASRRFTAESHVQAQSPNPAIVRSNLWRARMHRSEGRRHSTSLLCDQKLSATEQSRLRPAQDSKKQKYPPRGEPLPKRAIPQYGSPVQSGRVVHGTRTPARSSRRGPHPAKGIPCGNQQLHRRFRRARIQEPRAYTGGVLTRRRS
jgi:hypothetical protein